MDKDNNMDVDVETAGNFFNDPSFADLPSAPPSTPNSSASSPPIANDDFNLAPQGFLQNILSQLNHGINDANFGALSADSKQALSRRGPGRPRKDNPMLFIRNISGGKTQQKRKTNKDGSTLPSPLEAVVRNTLSMISSAENSNAGYPEEKSLTPVIDEPPYFPEKHPGKLCCLCNLSERSALGQGDLLRFEVSESSAENATEDVEAENELELYKEDDKSTVSEHIKNTTPVGQAGMRRVKNASRCKLLSYSEDLNELDRVGQVEGLTLKSLLDGPYLYIHQNCAMWSLGFNSPGLNSIEEISSRQIEILVEKSLKRKCGFCGMFGATVNCRMSCPKEYHMPCAAAASCFLIIETYTAFCSDHITQVPHLCASDVNIDCRQCATLGDMSKLIMCSICGDHYHTTCIGLADLPDTRAGWSCMQCCKCQICRQTDSNEARPVKCEQCQKVYHATCLRPILSSVPKYGWKCRRCRVCTDCGSRTPGAGHSSRWHCHYTICDSCYQQRNKGLSCPMCHKAYRAAAHKEMVRCSTCGKFVHSTCDSEADLAAYQKRKELTPEYEYSCPMCKAGYSSSSNRASGIDLPYGAMTPGRETPFGEGLEFDFSDKLNGTMPLGNAECSGPSYGKPYDAFRISKKRIGRGGAAGAGKLLLQKQNMLTQIGRKRSVRGKNRNMLLMAGAASSNSGSGANLERSNSRQHDADYGNEKKLLLCSTKDKFVLSQDICVMCGAMGMDQEAALISCAQCGQCYHPFCANIKLSKVMLQKGWRCLDCTVCEGCGQKNDEARLILCDDCDISYHIYCMSPPLENVPNGNWKCKWCAVCNKCGRTTPGKNCNWRNGFLECGPCASQLACCVCLQAYKEHELIIQCANCERWLHCQCDTINNEEEAKLCDKLDYHCVLCRPKDQIYPAPLMSIKQKLNHITPFKLQQQQQQQHSPTMNGQAKSHSNNINRSGLDMERAAMGLDDSAHWVDGVCVSERGLSMIKSLTCEVKKKRKLRPSAEAVLNKDSAIMAAIESVVAASSLNTGGMDEQLLEEELAAKKKLDSYKDGMIWTGAQDSPPEGFFITTNDEGVSILRKKRQRNLQKLGIGGFNVRNRAMKKDGNSIEESAGNEQNASNNISAALALANEKKKKMARKKLKSKLCDTYPAYLQEAFFGKSLLDATPNKESLHCESDQSEDNLDNNTTLLFAMNNAEQQQQQHQRQQVQVQQPQQQLQVIKTDEQNAITPHAMQIKVEIDTHENNSNLTGPISETSTSTIMPENSGSQQALEGNHFNCSITPKLEPEFKEENVQLAKDGRLLLSTSCEPKIEPDDRLQHSQPQSQQQQAQAYTHTATNKATLSLDINSEANGAFNSNNSNNNSNNNKINHSNSTVNATFINHPANMPPTKAVLSNFGQQYIQSANSNEFGSPVVGQLRRNFFQTASNNNNNNNSNIQVLQSNLTSHLTTHMENTQLPILAERETSLPINTLVTATVENRQIVQQPQAPMPHQQLDKQNYNKQPQQMNFVESVLKANEQPQQDVINTASIYQQQQRDGALKTFLLPTKAPTNNPTTPPAEEGFETNVAGTQKTAEKMRRDEGLGEMATISAVLYANTQHPELKQMYPNWSDRCKQILKRWRSLSTEKKAPFLQHAKDNRSALRMRRAQQDQEKICFQQKTLKEQEQERIWKQHQAKAKEAHTSVYNADVKPFSMGIESDKPQLPQQHQLQQQQQQPQQLQQQRFTNMPSNAVNAAFKSNYMGNMLTQTNVTVMSNKANELDKNDGSMQIKQQQQASHITAIDNVDNKQLRTLLQRQEYTATWVATDAKMNLTETQQQQQVTSSTSATSTHFQQHHQQQQHQQSDANKMNIMLEVHKIPGRMQQQQVLGVAGENTTITVKNVSITQQQQSSTENSALNVLRQQQQAQQSTEEQQQQQQQHNSVPDNPVTVGSVELERLDQYENTGLGDILGGLGEGDDDELFQSLTSEIGEDFNILEYADPELDVLATNQNLLNKLDFDDNDKNT